MVPAAGQQVLRRWTSHRAAACIEYTVRRGVQVFGISWRNPTGEQRDWDLDTYVAAGEEAI